MNIEKMAKVFVERSFSITSKDVIGPKMFGVLADLIYQAYLCGAKDVLENMPDTK